MVTEHNLSLSAQQLISKPDLRNQYLMAPIISSIATPNHPVLQKPLTLNIPFNLSILYQRAINDKLL